MSCTKYENYELGRMDKRDFFAHLENCSECSDILQKDELLMQTAKDFYQEDAVPDLWLGIEETLKKEAGKPEFNLFRYVNDHKSALIRIAAILLITITAGYYMLSQREPDAVNQSGILDQIALKDVIDIEQEYLEAIEQLEKSASQRLTVIDENLINLYNNKIRVIDQQIAYCTEALDKNPASTHIRRYLYAVLQDKKQTLEEILTYPI